jgi:hypothetical protein
VGDNLEGSDFCGTQIKEYTRERVPLHWAATQNNLGSTLGILAERECGTARLEQALSACESAVTVFREAGLLQYESYFETRLRSLRSVIAERSLLSRL